MDIDSAARTWSVFFLANELVSCFLEMSFTFSLLLDLGESMRLISFLALRVVINIYTVF